MLCTLLIAEASLTDDFLVVWVSLFSDFGGRIQADFIPICLSLLE